LIFQGFLLLLPFKVAGNTILLDSRERLERKEAEIVVDPTRVPFALVGNPLLKKNGFIRVDKHALPVTVSLSYKGTKTD
jgi:hypothetical protein